ncbi:hypothetical protein HPP92_021665 [Vanilla planifolia]|uniref:Uncharacterized protein n=1 Tax=Vanilla planifolia TaxID=51239 RepID=A0A835Q098_VANPL|nr:hypothetical protein HPP92_021665 [Vanilla planifolia]
MMLQEFSSGQKQEVNYSFVPATGCMGQSLNCLLTLAALAASFIDPLMRVISYCWDSCNIYFALARKDRCTIGVQVQIFVGIPARGIQISQGMVLQRPSWGQQQEVNYSFMRGVEFKDLFLERRQAKVDWDRSRISVQQMSSFMFLVGTFTIFTQILQELVLQEISWGQQ